MLYNHIDLRWQYDWAGASLINKRILVCAHCEDTPQEQLRAIVLPADPVPIINPRVQDFANDESDYFSTNAPTVYDATTGIPIPSTTDITTENGIIITPQPIGAPLGLDQNAQMPLVNNVKWGVALPVVSISSIGTNTVTVTCSQSHNLLTDAQVAVQGITDKNASGFYSITVTTATAFTYTTNKVIPSGSLITGKTLVTTVNVGLPYDYAQIPQTGV
jgi:hypothetical protein